MKHRRTRSTPRFAALSAGIAVALASTMAAGQDVPEATEQQATTLDRIEVTGSRIRQVDTETAQPIVSIRREDIESQGFTSVVDILQNVTSTGDPPLTRSSPLSSGEALGGSFIELRNLKATRTLVLVNGKRLGIMTGGFQDISALPVSMIERIDVLKDGASSVYGSDAIAGVINIITRSEYEGAQANVYYGQYGQGDGAKQSYDFVLGSVGERGSLTAAAEFAKEDVVWASDRWFSEISQNSAWTTVGQYGRIHNFDGVSGNNLVLAPGGNPYDLNDFRLQDTTPVTGEVSNTNQQMQVITPVERTALYVNGRYDMTDDIVFKANVLYNDRSSEAQVAGYPLQSAVFPTVRMSADSYYNPAGTWHGYEDPQSIGWSRRTWEIPRRQVVDRSVFQITTAIEGQFDIGDRYWDWDAGYMHSKSSQKVTDRGNLSVPSVALAVGPSFLNDEGVVQCGTPDDPIPYGSTAGECIPWNPLLSFGVEGSGSLTGNPELAAFLFPTLQSLGETETDNYFANISGSLASLPAGELGAAAGYEHRREQGGFSPDALSQSGDATSLAGGPTYGGYSLDELYVEFAIPILADVPGARELGLNLSSRYSDYSTFGDTVNSKFGFTWRPVETLMLRGTWAEGFRAPSIEDLYGATGQGFPYFTDPCDVTFGIAGNNQRCLQDVPEGFRQLMQGFIPADGPESQSPVPFNFGSNPALTPENSVSHSLGVVYSPGFVDGLNIVLDWWKIRIDNTILTDTATAILDDCYVKGIESRCQAFERDPETGMVTDMLALLVNAGFLETEGFDLEVGYRWQGDLGRFQVNWGSTYTSKHEIKIDNLETTTPQQNVGMFDTNGGVFRLRSNLKLSWDRNDFGASWTTRYYSAMKEDCFFFDEDDNPLPPCNIPDYVAPGTDGAIAPKHRHGPNVFHDVQVRWNAPWNATISAGANNVFEHYGPLMTSQPNANFDYYGGFDVGRFIYLKYQQRF
ncbi:TonB-dependent receptor plug domain-containing protein [Luteimonas sp. R10]|uniref:TonB-dependent receptor plug domain-containing protein n=1 Tax=Luteimonas sp. R10 TaxID=3108176 RepID=UPI0030894200|nr:TonB-dependent receptor [Luteimonas sp. R10]